MLKKYSITKGNSKLKTYFIYHIARLSISLFRVLPRAFCIWLLDILAVCAYYLDFRHRHIARVNLQIAFPELSSSERGRIARKSFQNTARNLLEISRLPTLTPQNISSLVEYDNRQGLNNFRSAQEKGKGILYLTGHFSAWELLPTAHALYGHPLSFVTRPLDNDKLEQYLIKIRESKGNRVISKKKSARYILEDLKARNTVGILMDQNTSLQEGIFADFFGIPAATSLSVALFSLRTEAPVLPGYLTPMHKGRYTIKFLAPLEPIRSGDMSRDLEINTRLFNEIFEKIIREQPESWLWGHKRWKNQPPGYPQDIYSLSPKQLEEFLNQKKRK